MSLAVSAHIHVLHFSCSNCISGHHLSTKSGCSDQWSYRYRATDIMISICGPLHMREKVAELCWPLDYEVLAVGCKSVCCQCTVCY